MSEIGIQITGPNFNATFANNWDICEKNGYLHIEDLSGWYGGVGADVVPDLKRFRRHGKFPAPTIRTGRDIDLTLTWVQNSKGLSGPEAYRVWSRLASGIAWDKGPYQMRVNEDGFILYSSVQLNGEIQHQKINQEVEGGFRVRIPFRAADPFLYGFRRQATVFSSKKAERLHYNMFSKKGITTKNGKQVITWGDPRPPTDVINNRGNAEMFPTYEVTASSPKGVRISLNGRTIEYGGPLFPQAKLTIDCKNGRALIGGADHSVNLVHRQWHSVPPDSQSTPQISFPGGGDGFAVANFWDTYI